MRSGAYKRKKAGKVNVPVLLSPDQKAMVQAAAMVHGVSMTRWIRECLTREAVFTLLAAQNRHVRLAPGTVIWAVARDLTVVAKKVAVGDEKAYIVAPADVPRVVDPEGAGFVIDIVSMGSGYVVSRNSFRWVGKPYRRAAVAPSSPIIGATEGVDYAKVDDCSGGGVSPDAPGVPGGSGHEGDGRLGGS